MNAKWFDTLKTSVSRSGTRRGLIAALPLAGAVGVLLGEEATQGKRKKKCAKAGQTPNNGKRKGCCNGLTKAASGLCAAPDPISCTGLKPTATGDTKGLQEAIDGAEDGATLTLCAGIWNLTNTITIDKNLTLIGAGSDETDLDGGNTVRVLDIEAGATVTLRDLTIRNGNTGQGNTHAYSGGGIRNVGTLTLLEVSVTGNTASLDGGGIYNHFASTLTLQTGSRVTGNFAMDGGGVWNAGTLILEDGAVIGGVDGEGNTANYEGGGGIYNYQDPHQSATVTLQAGSRVMGNTANQSGGGIYNNGGTVTLDSGAMICSNLPLNNQCLGTISGTCPAPDQTCP